MRLLKMFVILSVFLISTRRTSSSALHSYIYIKHTLARYCDPENKLFLNHRLLILSVTLLHITLAMKKRIIARLFFTNCNLEREWKGVVLNTTTLLLIPIVLYIHKKHFFVTEK